MKQPRPPPRDGTAKWHAGTTLLQQQITLPVTLAVRACVTGVFCGAARGCGVITRIVMATGQATLSDFVKTLCAKQPTPGGGAAAAVGAAVGAAAAQMAAAYTQRKKDVESGAAAAGQELIGKLDVEALLASADADAAAYADLQRSWKDAEMTAEEKAAIEATALSVPVTLVE